MLHFTNGGSAAQLIRGTDLGGDVVPWNDVLHEGPVPSGLALAALSEVRAHFIADAGWAPYADVAAEFRSRDAALAGSGAHGTVALWFEHDLYDQLQLLQILDWIAGQAPGTAAVSLIVIDHFPGVDRFVGLGQLTVAQLWTLWDGRQPLTPEMLDLARTAWAAFRSPDPAAIERVLHGDTRALPFVWPALLRHLEQFPAVGTGLARTERTILELIAAGVRTPLELFAAEQAREERPFLGDTTFWSYVAGLSAGTEPLVTTDGGGRFTLPGATPHNRRFPEQALSLTERGRTVLAGSADRIGLDGVDRWLGGVHLTGADAAWRWDPQARKLVQRSA